ncbi:MAG: LysM peptidoglycan-binding domain-containing protein [Kiritimatiellae bacterium]|nr:LysM peptidoglycan-binding domain-containing protein [Kiritimatiellia bacterium]
MKTAFSLPFLAAGAAVALVAGCVSAPQPQASSRRTLFGDSSGSSGASEPYARKAVVHTASSHRGAAASAHESEIRPVRIDERPLDLNDVGPAGRVQRKASLVQSAPAAASAPPPARTTAVPPRRVAPAATSGGAYRVYTVQSGDTALGIAIANSMTLDQLKALNPEIASAPDRLRIGQGVKVYSAGGGQRSTVLARGQNASGAASAKPAKVTTAASTAKTPSSTARKSADAASSGTAKKTAVAPAPARDVEAPPKPASDVKVADTDATIEDVFSTGLAGAKDKAREKREEAEKAARDAAAAEKARLEAAQKAAEEQLRKAEEAKRQAEQNAAKAAGDTAAAAATAVSSTAARDGEYVVQQGDDIFSIALKFDVMPLALRKANGSDLSDLKAGQVLKIPPKD